MPEEALLTEEERTVDVCILGTGLVESLAAAALARHGKRVLHIDRGQIYGGSWRALSLAEFEAWASGAEARAAAPAADVEPGGGDAAPEARAGSRQVPPPDRDIGGLTAIDLETSCAPCFRLRSGTWDPFSTRTEAELEVLRSELLQRSGAFSMDLCPRLLFGRSEMVDVLVESGVARYLEFQGLRSARVLTPTGLVAVPLTKSDIFQDPVLTLAEKRALMRFITSMAPFVGSLAFESPAQLGVDQARKVKAPTECGAPDTLEGVDPQESWGAFLQRQKLSPRLQDFLTYAICMWDWAQPHDEQTEGVNRAQGSPETLLAGEGLRCLGRFISSLGMHGRGTGMPLLYPMYGVSEMAQGFTRMCALHRGTYALRTFATQLLASRDADAGGWHIAGLVTNRGEVVRTASIVASCDHLLQRSAQCSTEKAGDLWDTQAVCIKMSVLTDRPLLQEEGLNLCVVPPNATEPPLANVVQVLQLDWATGSCPRGYYVMHLSQAARASSVQAEGPDAFRDLDRVLAALLDQCGGGDVRRGCLFRCRYVLHPRSSAPRWDAASAPGEVLGACAAGSSLVVTSDPAAVPQLLLGPEVADARGIFRGLPLHGAEVPAEGDFLRKPVHVAMEERGSAMEDLEHFNEQMQGAADAAEGDGQDRAAAAQLAGAADAASEGAADAQEAAVAVSEPADFQQAPTAPAPSEHRSAERPPETDGVESKP